MAVALFLNDGRRHAAPLFAGDLDAISAASFGAVERLVSLFDQRVGGDALAEHRQPNAHADAFWTVLDLRGACEPAAKPLGNDAGGGELDLREDYQELLAAPARDDVVPADVFHERVGDLLKDAVAGAVSELVIDGLEVVHVAHRHAKPGVVAARSRDLFLEALAGMTTVVQPREAVG